MACKKDEPVPPKEFLIHFPFDGNFENLEDSNNNGKQIGGVTFIEDRFGNSKSACFFDGIDDRINFENTLGKNVEAYSVGAWYKVGTDFFNGNHVVVLRDETVTNVRITKVDSLSSMVCFDNYITSDWRSTCSVTATQDWFHMVGVYKSNADTKLYINGELVNKSSSISSDDVSSDLRFDSYLGAIIRENTTEDPNTFWNGGMDDFRLYQKALTATEVFDLYNAQSQDNNF